MTIMTATFSTDNSKLSECGRESSGTSERRHVFLSGLVGAWDWSGLGLGLIWTWSGLVWNQLMMKWLQCQSEDTEVFVMGGQLWCLASSSSWWRINWAQLTGCDLNVMIKNKCVFLLPPDRCCEISDDYWANIHEVCCTVWILVLTCFPYLHYWETTRLNAACGEFGGRVMCAFFLPDIDHDAADRSRSCVEDELSVCNG